MSFKLRDAKELGDAIAHWIALRSLLGRIDYLSERNLSEPISDFLFSRTRNWNLLSEYNHPAIQQPKRGRPKQLDFVLLQNQTVRVCIETKFGNCSPIDLVNDLLRLALFQKHALRLFVHVLKDADFTALHDRRMSNGGTHIRRLSGFLGTTKERQRTNFNRMASNFGAQSSRHDRWVGRILSDFNAENPLVDGTQFPGGITSVVVQKESFAGYTTYVLLVGRLKRVQPLDFALLANCGISDEEAGEV
jgi:hypothetical protein